MGCGDHYAYLLIPGSDPIAIPGHSGPVNSIQEIDASTIVTGSWDGSFHIIDLNTLQIKRKVEGFSYATTLLVYQSLSTVFMKSLLVRKIKL